jgi:SAM-dependent methyltransferase
MKESHMGICKVNPLHGGVNALFERNGFAITRCVHCGLIMADCPFAHDQYEADSYYTMRWTDQASIYSHWAFRWRWIARKIERMKPNGSILDVGAGNGSFVKIAREEYCLRPTGIETSRAEVEFAKRVLDEDLRHQSLEQVKSKFDVVTGFNVIEHVSDPIALLHEMAGRTKQDGLIVLTTPSPRSIQARVLGLERWEMICPPHHLNIFTQMALAQSLATVGFEVVEYDTLSTYINFVRRIEGDRNILRELFFQAFRLLGIGADHFVIARRIAA